MDSSMCVAETFPEVKDLPRSADLPDPFRNDGWNTSDHERTVVHKTPSRIEGVVSILHVWLYAPNPPVSHASISKTDPTVIRWESHTERSGDSFFYTHHPKKRRASIWRCLCRIRASGPFPVFLALNKCGNQTVVSHEGVTIDPDAWRHSACMKDNKDARGAKEDFWCVENLIDRGYAFATFHESDIDPDKDDFTDGIHPPLSGPGAV